MTFMRVLGRADEFGIGKKVNSYGVTLVQMYDRFDEVITHDNKHYQWLYFHINIKIKQLFKVILRNT